MIHRPTKLLHTVHLGHFRVAAGADGGNEALEAAIGRVIDDPAALLVLVHLLHLGIEPRPRVQPVLLPDLTHLADDLLAVRIAALPLARGVEPVREGMDL